MVELPYTIPQDHTTFTLLRQSTVDLWLRQLELIVDSAGLAQCVSHPDPGYLGDRDKESLYVEFLDAVAERDDVWRALPREVAAWWRERDAARGEPALEETGIASIDESGEVLLQPAARQPPSWTRLCKGSPSRDVDDLRWRRSVMERPIQ